MLGMGQHFQELILHTVLNRWASTVTKEPPQEHPPAPPPDIKHADGARPPRTCPRVTFSPRTDTVGLAEAEAGPGR